MKQDCTFLSFIQWFVNTHIPVNVTYTGTIILLCYHRYSTGRGDHIGPPLIQRLVSPHTSVNLSCTGISILLYYHWYCIGEMELYLSGIITQVCKSLYKRKCITFCCNYLTSLLWISNGEVGSYSSTIVPEGLLVLIYLQLYYIPLPSLRFIITCVTLAKLSIIAIKNFKYSYV